ncbi:MAG TPA: helix-turn-helix domain-containing protein [Solirubrobacterales bacterium]|nr:helix-turn-helix domain-containing protein [Solirubrobacterales bacterium]
MNRDHEEFWSALPEKVIHPVRVPVVEALRWIDEPLSAIEIVDVLDGFVSMWEAAHHLRALQALGVVKLVPADHDEGKRNDSFAEQFRLTRRDGTGREGHEPA